MSTILAAEGTRRRHGTRLAGGGREKKSGTGVAVPAPIAVFLVKRPRLSPITMPGGQLALGASDDFGEILATSAMTSIEHPLQNEPGSYA